MTRKDYVLIAEAMKDSRPAANIDKGSLTGMNMWSVWIETGRNIAAALQTDNPNFNRSRFLAACGV